MGRAVKEGTKPERTRNPLKLSGPLLVIFLLVVTGLLIAAWVSGYFLYKARKSSIQNKNNDLALVDKSLQNNDSARALVYARQALAKSPSDINAIMTVADLTQKSNPEESKRLYAKALAEFKKTDNPDVDLKTAITYWAAAGMAERAGLTDQAKGYYQKVINSADLGDSYDKSLAQQSEAALKRLQ